MMHSEAVLHESHPDAHQDIYSKTVFGFWLYLMTDFILFATLFATYVVLRQGMMGGHVDHRQLFDLSYTFIQSLILLTCSLTSGYAGVLTHRKNKNLTVMLWGITFLLGCVFLGMQLNEFTRFVHENNSWDKSGFLSGYFTVVGTHSAHMIFALLWIIILLIPVCRYGITSASLRRLTCLRMFWQFLNVIWVFIYTIIYLMG